MKRKITAAVTLIVMIMTMLNVVVLARTPSASELESLYFDIGISECMGSYFSKEEGVSAYLAIQYFKMNGQLDKYIETVYVEE